MIGYPKELIRYLLNQDKLKVFEVNEHHEKRSLNANAYAWALIGKIADEIRSSKEEVYMIMLKRYGQHEVISVRSDIDISGYVKYYEPFATGYIGQTQFTHYKVYKGSSEFNTKEMSVLIDGIISEAKELDIETLPPAEIQRMKERWNVK